MRAILVLAIVSVLLQLATAADPNANNLSDMTNNNARVGVALLDFEGTIRNVQRGDERFAMCSTFKFLAVAAVLHRIDRGEDKPDRVIRYTERDILAWAPVTKQHLREGGMSLEALCFAAIAYSDNTAGNLLLQTLGGPAGLTAYARSLGDQVTRLDRTEPDLNRVGAGDERDTTSPLAMLWDMQKVLLGDDLSPSAREKLESWLVQNTTGDTMIRVGVPKEWRVGDKTGRNDAGNCNDIAIIRRPDGRAILLAIYVEVPGGYSELGAKIIADVSRELVASWQH